jgi:magnesium and cobalt transporter
MAGSGCPDHGKPHKAMRSLGAKIHHKKGSRSLEEGSEQSLLGLLKNLIRKKSHLYKGSDLTEEIHDLMNEGQAKGLISDEESYMVHGVLDLKDITASSIMIPRTVISSTSTESTLQEVIDLVRECGHTRIPVYEENVDRIVGILHAKDLLKLWGKDPKSKIPKEILRRPYFVPESKKVSELLTELKEMKSHLAVVTDEYGGTAGLVTIEDIIEEIVGEIMDEHDPDVPLLQIIDENSVLVDARLEIEKLEDHFSTRLPEGEFESVGGFIINLTGEIPKVDQKITYDDLEMIIESADERKIKKILVTHLSSIPSSKNANQSG